MFGVHQEKIGDVSVIICTGRMAGCDAALELGDEVRRHGDARVVLLDLSEVGVSGCGRDGDTCGFAGVDSGLGNSVQIIRPSAWRAAKPATATFDC